MLYFKNIRMIFIGHGNTYALQACQMRDRIMEEVAVKSEGDSKGQSEGERRLPALV